MNKNLENLAKLASLVGIRMYAKDRVTLFDYNEHGKITGVYYYNLHETESILRLITQKSNKLRNAFVPEFNKLLPTTYELGMDIVRGVYAAYLVPAGVENVEKALLECPYSKEGIDKLSDFLGDAFARNATGESLPQPDIEMEPEPSDLPTGIALSKELAEEIVALWDGMTNAEQEELSKKRGQKLTDLILEATGILQQHD